MLGEGGLLPILPHQLPAMPIALAAALRISCRLTLLSYISDLVLTFERASKTFLTCDRWFSCHQVPYCLMTVLKCPAKAVLDIPE